MGGFGSGGSNKAHGTVEQYRRIDSFELLRHINEADEPHEIFDPVFYGSSHFKLHWAWGVDGSRSRLYFGCPCCGRRVRYLYDRGGSYVCRRCLGANYESQQMMRGTIADIRRQMRKIVEDQLGYTWWRHDNPGSCIDELDNIPRPRYMRWEKYSRLMMEYRQLQDDYTREQLKICGAFLPPGWRNDLNKFM